MSSNRILIIDDEQAVCWALDRALKKEGYVTAIAATAEDGIAQAERFQPQAIFLDVRLPGMDGLTALAHLRAKAPAARVVVATAFGNLSTAVRAMEGGAFDYLAKPFDLGQALDIAARAVRSAEAAHAAEPPADAPPPELSQQDIIGRSAAMQAVYKRIALVAPRDACVLITGESGAGKELVARAIHRYSARADKPFLPVHIAALNPSLVESELFGHVRGAFTGATQTRQGLLALANEGTVFLDELADIPLAVQAKLLRVLEHGEVLPVGANQPQPLNVRILAATHQDLAARAAEGTFRHDLYFRLNVFQVHLPPLRERPEDILPLAEHFLRRVQANPSALPEETRRYLVVRPWLGNVRELRNAVEHAAIVARGGPILPEHFPNAAGLNGGDTSTRLADAVRQWLAEALAAAGSNAPENLYDAFLAKVEPALLEDIMRRTQGNRWQAAQWLGLNRATVRKKLVQYGLAEAGRDEE
jgi:two-component system nitrogen regulation response regulator GlnG